MRHIVAPEDEGKRLDVVLARVTGLSRSIVAAAVKSGAVTVAGEPAKPSRPLVAGEEIEYEIAPPRPLVAHPQALPLSIVYEDDDLLVVNKPPGMVTHPARGVEGGTLVNALLAHLGTLPGDPIRAGLVHRLDRDTSGLLVVAKHAESLALLGRALQRRRIERTYLGLVQGIPTYERGTLDGPIGRDPNDRLKRAVVASGKPAVTHYEVRERFPRHSELVFRLETGRTHQIRVHMAALGHPLVNDPLYGRLDARSPLPGQALHAWRLRLRHPRSGEDLAFEAEPPPAYLITRERLRDA